MKIGVVICNFNKKHFIIPCIESVLNSDMKEIDVYVVDNASTDGSAEEIRETFGDQVTLIVNTENLGGSGGFNTGLRRALEAEEKYPYLMCVDNDILMDSDNIRLLYEFMEDHLEVGMAGSKICRMQNPERLQEMGAMIDFQKCAISPFFKDQMDDDSLPEVQYCDYVPACSLIIRREVIEKVGIMPEQNFIYWDDMEWGYKVNQAGYKVASVRSARVLHDMGTKSGTNYFSTYYFWRNRLRFFMNFTPEDLRENMKKTLLENLFQTLYGCYYKGKENQIQIMMHAFDDAVHGHLGKAKEGVILPKDEIEDRILNLMRGKKKIVIGFDGNFKMLQDLVLKSEKAGDEDGAKKEIVIACEDTEDMKRQHPECRVISAPNGNLGSCMMAEQDQLLLQMCEHVSKIEDQTLQKVYVDGYSNLLADENDLIHFASYDYLCGLFIKAQSAVMDK